MKIYIYSYINKTNGHRYIGKTNNIERRKREHKSMAYNPRSHIYNTVWCKKIRQYGYENFDFVILEEANETNWAEREQYWIKYYNTFNGAGYNETPGGDLCGERQKVLTDDKIPLIYKDLIDSNMTQIEIALKYSISTTLLSNINLGLKYTLDGYIYPLRKNYKTEEDYSKLYDLLKNTDHSFRQIATELNIGESTVKKINYGKLRFDPNKTYPIRPYQRKHKE